MSTLLSLPARLLRRHRRVAATVFAALAVACLAMAARPAPPPTRAVLVAARDLPPGATLKADDLAVAQLPVEVAPESALGEPGPVVGRMLAGPVGRGVPVTATSVVGAELAATTPGTVLAPVRFPDPDLASLLAPGAVVDVVSAQERGAEVVARGARVVTVPQAPAAGGPFSGSSDTRGLLVILAVTPDEATELAQAGARGRLGLALR